MSRRKLNGSVLIKRGIDGVARDREQERVAVGRRADHGLRGEIGAAPGLFSIDDRLAEPLRQPAADDARNEIGRAAGGIGR